MRLLHNPNDLDPAVHLALEEHCCLRMASGEAGVLLYVNGASVIIGRNQNPLQEADWAYLQKGRTPLLRRMSGGGAVYHDSGNLNFCFIGPSVRDRERHYRALTAPIREALRVMGAAADWNSRNDLMIDGRKVSGNAHYIAGGRMMSHGTLLFDADLDALAKALRPTLSPKASKATASVRTPVANIKGFLKTPMGMADFRERILEALKLAWGGLGPSVITASEWRDIHDLADRKYRGWDWTMGRTPAFTRQVEVPVGGVASTLAFHVERGVVADVVVGPGDRVQEALWKTLVGCRFEVAPLADRLARIAGPGAAALALAHRVFGLP